jgi:hypothetical protein
MSIEKLPTFTESIADDIINEGIIDFFKGIWEKITNLVKGEQKVFFEKFTKESSKTQKVRMLNVRIEELAQRYVEKVMEMGKKPEDLIDIEKDLIQLFKVYYKVTGKTHKRDVHRKTGLFNRVFLWQDLIPKGVTVQEIEQQYRDKIDSIRRRADRKIQRAEEELEYFMTILK